MEHDGPPLEPARVLRPRRTDALAELFRERGGGGGESGADSGGGIPGTFPGAYEPVSPSARPRGSEDDTQELPPVPADTATPGSARRSHPAWSRAVFALAVTTATLVGFGAALLLPDTRDDTPAESATPPPPASAAPDPTPSVDTPSVDPDGPGTLREGDSGPEVVELQQRLLNVPDVYVPGSTSGRYDATLTEAVARFQLWYGIRGDETGVYGDDTRLALESRTSNSGG